MTSEERVYDEVQVHVQLGKKLPTWTFADGHIQRVYNTSGWKGTLMVVNAIGHLAEAAWHHPDIEASYNHVTVKLMNHAAKGITDKDFELAQKIEDMVMWQPGKADGALEGTPDDDRYRYIKYED